MRTSALVLVVLSMTCPTLAAQSVPTADHLIAKYIARVGGMERIAAATSIRRTGKFIGGGGFEAVVVQENKRPNLVREEFLLQGMTAINAYDGKSGWKIDPFGGKKDAESLTEEEMHGILADADFDEPLVNYKSKGYKAEYTGMDQVEGTDVYKVRITLANGDLRTYFMDTDSYVPIRMEEKRFIRGAEQEIETTLGDYKPVAGWLVPFAIEAGPKGQDKASITYQKIEVNVPLDDAKFRRPAAPAKPSGAVLWIHSMAGICAANSSYADIAAPFTTTTICRIPSRLSR